MFFSVPAMAGTVLVLKGPNLAPYKEALSGFRQAYPGGIEVEHGKPRDFSSRVQAYRPALIVAIGRASAELARQQTPAIPLVFMMVAYPAESGLTGSNVAGISMDV